MFQLDAYTETECLFLSMCSCNEVCTFLLNMTDKLCFMQTFYKFVRSWASKKFMTGCSALQRETETLGLVSSES
ncbi:hypothetical protein Golob_001600 [Gossypium lobatum]|uniref:Uncharacterized protein n=1 Tax=Gossypium lobatum TaxID=34289 RepID=A0A7J8NC09_9ROSI|nr:hypothetical protein [Gossypium lobatum]